MEEDNDYKLAFRRHFGTPSSGSESDGESNFLEHIKKYAPPPYDISEDNLVTISPSNAWLERANQNQVNIKNVQDHSDIVNSVSQNCNVNQSSQSASSQSTVYTETENVTTQQNKNSINRPSKKKRKKDNLKNRVLNPNEKPNSRNTGLLTSQNINKNGKTKKNINVNVSKTKNSSDKKNLADKKSIKVIDENVKIVDTNSPNFALASIKIEELTRQMMHFFETFTFPSQYYETPTSSPNYMTKESQINTQPDTPIHVNDISFPPLPDCHRKSRIDVSKTNTTDHGLPTLLHSAETPFPILSSRSTKVQTDKNAPTKKKLINNSNKLHNPIVKKKEKKTFKKVDEFQTSEVQIDNEYTTTITFGDFIFPRFSDVPTKSSIEINETDMVGLSSLLNVPFKGQDEQNSSTRTNFVDDGDQVVQIDTITPGDVFFQNDSDDFRKSRIEVNKRDTAGLPSLLDLDEMAFPSISGQSVKKPTKKSSTEKTSTNNTNQVQSTKKNEKKTFKKIDDIDLELGFVYNKIDSRNVGTEQKGKNQKAKSKKVAATTVRKEKAMKNRNNIKETNNIEQLTQMKINATPLKATTDYSGKPECVQVLEDPIQLLADANQNGTSNLAKESGVNNNLIRHPGEDLFYNEMNKYSLSSAMIPKLMEIKIDATTVKASTKYSEKPECVQVLEDPIQLLADANQNGTSNLAKESGVNNNLTRHPREDLFCNEMNKYSLSSTMIPKLMEIKIDATTLKASTKYSGKPECVQVLEDPIQLLADSNQNGTSNLAKESGVNNNLIRHPREDLCYNEMNKYSLSSTMIPKLMEIKIDATTLKASTKYSGKPECVREDPIQLLADSNQNGTSNLAKESGVNNNLIKHPREDLFYNEMNKYSLSSTMIPKLMEIKIDATTLKASTKYSEKPECVQVLEDPIQLLADSNQIETSNLAKESGVNDNVIRYSREDLLFYNEMNKQSLSSTTISNIPACIIQSTSTKKIPRKIKCKQLRHNNFCANLEKDDIFNPIYYGYFHAAENQYFSMTLTADDQIQHIDSNHSNTYLNRFSELCNNVKEDENVNFVNVYNINQLEIMSVGSKNDSSSSESIDKMSAIDKSSINSCYQTQNNGEENKKELWDMTALKNNTECGEMHAVVNNIKEDASFNFLYHYPTNKLETDNILVKVVNKNEPSSYLTNSIDCIDKMSSMVKSDINGSYEIRNKLKKNRKTNQVSTVPSLDEHMFSDNTKRLWLAPYEINCDHSAFEEPRKGKTCNKTEPKIINCKKSILGQFEEENVEGLVNTFSEGNDAGTAVINYSKATKYNSNIKSSENHDNLLKVPSLWRSIIYLIMTYVILQLIFSFLEWVLDNSFKIFILMLFGYFLNN